MIAVIRWGKENGFVSTKTTYESLQDLRTDSTNFRHRGTCTQLHTV